MTVFLPAPPRGSSAIFHYRQITGHRVVKQDGKIILEEFPSYNLFLSESVKDLRSSNKVIKLQSGSYWKPCSPYIRSALLMSYSDGRIRDLSNGYDVSYVGPPRKSLYYVGPFVEWSNGQPITPPANTRNRLNTELLLKVGSKKASYGESIAESRQAINHLAHTASTVVKSLLYARKGNWAKVASTLGVSKRSLVSGKSLSSRYLEYQYAWMPLINDIYDTHKLITNGFRQKSQIMSSVRNISDSFSGSDAPFSSNYSSVDGSSRVQYRAKVYYSVDDTSLSRINQLGLLNPAEIAWAVVPYSFVVDWFLPVGNFLEALTATVGVNFIDGFTSTRVTTNFTVKERLGLTEIGIPPSVSINGHGVFRQKMSGFPLPGLYVKSPFSTSHGFSAAALIRQLFK